MNDVTRSADPVCWCCKLVIDGNERMKRDGELTSHATAEQCAYRLREKVSELERAIKLQGNAAISGMNAAKAISSHQLDMARKLHAESSPASLESERAMNASLTAEVERLETEVANLRQSRETRDNCECPYETDCIRCRPKASQVDREHPGSTGEKQNGK
jgi:hypothetical protein